MITPEWIKSIGGYVLIILGALGLYEINNRIQQGKGKQEAEAEANAGELEAHKRKEKRDDEVTTNNRALPRRKLFARMRKQADKNGN